MVRRSIEQWESLNVYCNLTQNNFSINTNQNIKIGNDITNSDNPLIKEIEYALKKEEFQPEIVKLKYISLIVYVILIIISLITFGVTLLIYRVFLYFHKIQEVYYF